MNINFQIMEDAQKNEHGNYIPDFEKLVAGATCDEEITYIQGVRERFDKWLSKTGCEKYAGFAFNMIYITKQACGHFEIFQTPCNEYYSLEKNLELAKEHAERMKCSKCVCGWRDKK